MLDRVKTLVLIMMFAFACAEKESKKSSGELSPEATPDVKGKSTATETTSRETKPDSSETKAASPETKTAAAIDGSCQKETSAWKTAGGGCLLIEEKLVFSAVLHSGSVDDHSPKKLAGSLAKSACEALKESGFEDWRLPNKDELSKAVEENMTDFLNFASDNGGRSEYMHFLDPADGKVHQMWNGNSTSIIQESDDHVRMAFCVREF